MKDFVLPVYLACCDIKVQSRHFESFRAKGFGDFPSESEVNLQSCRVA